MWSEKRFVLPYSLFLISALLLGNTEAEGQPREGKHGPCSAHPLNLHDSKPIYSSNYGASPLGVAVCDNSSPNSAVVWYSMAPPVGAKITVSTCSDYTTFNTILSLYSGSCATNLTCLLYTTIESNCNSLSFTSEGEYYLLAVSGFPGNSTGNFELTTEYEAEQTNNCTTAIKIPNSIIPLRIFTDMEASSMDNHCGDGGYFLYYQISLTEISTINVEGCEASDNLDSTAIFIQNLHCNSPYCHTTIDSCSLRDYELGKGHYVIGVGKEKSSSHPFWFQYSVVPSVSSTCRHPTEITIEMYRITFTTGSTIGERAMVNDPCGKITSSVMWYKVSLEAGGIVTISTCGSSTNFDTVLAAYGNNCSSLSCLAYNDDDSTCSDTTASTIVIDFPPNPFYFVVGGAAGSSGDYSLYISLTST